MKKSERLDSLNILVALFTQKKNLSVLFKNNNSTPLTKEICFGVCRYFYRLEIIANELLSKKPKEKDIDIYLAILIGLYQLDFLNIPEYAVVKETVELVAKINKTWAKGLVNAILRNFCRKKTSIEQKYAKNIIFTTSHPEWFIEKILNTYPEDAHTILHANNAHPPMTLRVNNRKTSTIDYLKKLNSKNLFGSLSKIVPTAIILDKPTNVTELPGFQEGEVSVQDLAAQLAVDFLDLKPNLKVLDACCAPGGKTCHILETIPNLSSLLAIDLEKNRLARVQENFLRIGVASKLMVADANNPKKWWDGTLFDRILLDAPCSATGVIRRHPDIKILRSEEEIIEIQKVQQSLLNTLWPLLTPGGKLVYATCSILPEENDMQIAKFVQNHEDCECITTLKPFGKITDFGYQILPNYLKQNLQQNIENMDGFFYSVLKKN